MDEFAEQPVAIGKARPACAQSFALWQQATTEIMHRSHSIIACSRHIYIVVLRAHPVRGEAHNQRNANGEVATPFGHTMFLFF